MSIEGKTPEKDPRTIPIDDANPTTPMDEAWKHLQRAEYCLEHKMYFIAKAHLKDAMHIIREIE